MGDLAGVLRNLAGGCYGTVTRDGDFDACEKPVVGIIDGRGTDAETYWPACTYHLHRWGRGRVVPLADLLAVERDRTLNDAFQAVAASQWDSAWPGGLDYSAGWECGRDDASETVHALYGGDHG